MNIDLPNTIQGSLLDGFYPAGWDLARLDQLASLSPEDSTRRGSHWHEEFRARGLDDLQELEVEMGMEIAKQIRSARDDGRQLICILPVGPMGMYRWAVKLLRDAQVSCDHVHGFNMDEWSDADGNTTPGEAPGSFQNAMEEAFYGPLGEFTVPAAQRHFATKASLQEYPDRIAALRQGGARLVVVYGIGRVFHIAFWEPQFAAEFDSLEAWKAETHRVGAKLHPLTVEQNALTSFKSRFTLVPAFANTIGPGLFLQADYAIGGADGVFGRGMQWQGVSLKVALQHGPDPWVPASFMPTLPGTLFYLKELTAPLEPECN